MKITLCAILYENYYTFINFINTVIYPTINHYQDLEFEFIVADNSKMPNPIFEYKEIPTTYMWFGGRNEFYAGAINKVLPISTGEFFVYLCSNHCKMNDPTWLEDILLPFSDEKVAMAGCYASSDFHYINEDGFGKHIQGGIFAARKSYLIPYNLEYNHLYSDVWICHQLEKLDFKLAHVPSINSVWRSVITNPKDYKLVHHEG